MAMLTQEEKKSKFSVTLEKIPVQGYAEVYKAICPETGLTAVIALHDLTLGPALGGIRIQPYPTFDLALTDALRLSKGMTYKSAVSRCGWGGGKSVIIADPKKQKTEKLLKSFGAAVHMLEGKYICAEDAGCDAQDTLVIREETPYVVGLPNAKSSGDPSAFTAWGIFRGLQASLKAAFGTESFTGKRIAIQGVGHVGAHLAELLFWHGAKLILCDVDGEKVAQLAARYDAKVVSVQEIYSVECDLFVPCALGGIINEKTIPQLKCKIVAGAANNQLLRDSDGDLLRAKNILYAPDFVINAGGLLNVSEEIAPEGYSPSRSLEKINGLYEQLSFIYDSAKKNGISTHQAAIDLGNYNLKYGVGKRSGAVYFHHSDAILNT